MKVVAFSGGLGNQMFQYVFYTYLKKRTEEKILGFYGRKELRDHNGLELERCFTTCELPPQTMASEMLVNLYKLKNKISGNIGIPEDDHLKNKVFYGYWHDLKYFDSDSPGLFTFRVQPQGENLTLLEQIRNTESVSVHIRRGDYVKFNSIYGNICTPEYYKKAIAFLTENLENPQFVFFSDDIPWVKEHFAMEGAAYVDWNTGNDSYLDMFLMSECRHNIIANSTFSWWGAYLNQNPHKTVVAPARWINLEDHTYNIFPETWIRL